MTIYKPNDTIVEDLRIAARELDDRGIRPLITYSLEQHAKEMQALWNEQHACGPFGTLCKEKEPEKPQDGPRFRAILSAVILSGILAEEGSADLFDDKSLDQQVEASVRYADTILRKVRNIETQTPNKQNNED